MTSLYVLFQVAQSDYVLEAADVLLMESFSGVTQVPGAPAHVLGIIQLRGRVLPVIDLRARFGMEPARPTWTPGWWWCSAKVGRWPCWPIARARFYGSIPPSSGWRPRWAPIRAGIRQVGRPRR